MSLQELLSIIDPKAIIETAGLIGVVVIIFLETGMFFGFFFPGDSLLFTAGFLASQGYISLPLLLTLTFIAAVLGDSVGYAFGKRVGPSIFSKEDSLFFNKKYVAKAQSFFVKYGKKTIILARFIPIVRTFAPILAGVGQMEYKTFITYNVVGGFVWTWGMLWLGYGFGSLFDNPDAYILPIVLVIIAISFLPPAWEIVKRKLRPVVKPE